MNTKLKAFVVIIAVAFGITACTDQTNNEPPVSLAGEK